MLCLAKKACFLHETQGDPTGPLDPSTGCVLSIISMKRQFAEICGLP